MTSGGGAGSQFGQRSLSSLFQRRTSSISNKEPPANPSKKSVSLSEFLDRKLHKNNNGSLQRKQFPFPDRRSASEPIDETVLRRFISRPKQDCEECAHLSKKRKSQYHIPAESEGEKSTTQKVLVLGDDPKPRRELKINADDKGVKPQFDHYASGSGLWDGDREGVNGDDVGFKEIWEGVGSASLGGLEWH